MSNLHLKWNKIKKKFNCGDSNKAEIKSEQPSNGAT